MRASSLKRKKKAKTKPGALEAHKLVSNKVYYSLTIVCYAIEIVVAIFLEDIEIVSLSQ